MRACVGLVTDTPGLFEQMKVPAYLDFFGSIYGLTPAERTRRIDELLEFVATEFEELGSTRERAHIERICREGTGADRQLAVWHRTHDMKAVVDQIVAETYEGLRGNREQAA